MTRSGQSGAARWFMNIAALLIKNDYIFLLKYLTFSFYFFMNPIFTKHEGKAKDKMNIIFQYAKNISKATGIRINFLWKARKAGRNKLPGLIMP